VTCFQAISAREAIESRPLEPVTGSIATSLRGWVRMLGAAAGLVVCSHSNVNLPDATFQPYRDVRFDLLGRFFQRYNCPEPQHVGDYLRVADGYGLDYRLLPALSIRETHCGIQEDTRNNHWGYHPGRQAFNSIEAGIDFVAQQLAKRPPYRGKTLQEKLFVYNPLPEYPGEVMRIMRQIE
jgi:hypothetical protein